MIKLKLSWYYFVPKKRKKEKKKNNWRDMNPILFPSGFLLGVIVDRIGAPCCRYASESSTDRIHESPKAKCITRKGVVLA